MKNKVLSLALIAAMVMSLLCGTAAAVAPADGIVAKNITTGETFDTLDEALALAENGQKIMVVGDCALEDDAVVESGVTLVIPTSAAGNDTITGNNASGAVVNGQAYVTLTIPAGITLTVDGTMLVAGNQQSTQPKTGCLTGDFGKVVVNGTLEVNCELYARGEVSGTGEVIANSSAKVYQMLQVRDWRGGTKAMNAYANGVFPFSLYEIKNITANTTYKNGSVLRAQYYIYAGGSAVCDDVVMIGPEGQIEFIGAATRDGNIQFTCDNDVITVHVNGTVKTGDMQVSLKQYGITIPISSAGKVCPFGYNMNVTISETGTLQITNDLKFLPGCIVEVQNGGTLQVDDGASMYFYGADDYLSTYNFNGSQTGWTSTANAKLVKNGTVNNQGTIAFTASALSDMPTDFTAILGEDGNPTHIEVKEYIQASGVTNVSFTPVTAASAAEEEPAAEEAVEEIVEEPVEEIVEISEELVEVEEAVIAE